MNLGTETGSLVNHATNWVMPGDDSKVLVIGMNCWGRAKTYAEALKIAKSEGGATAVKKHFVYRVGRYTSVTDMGYTETRPNSDGTYTKAILLFVKDGAKISTEVK